MKELSKLALGVEPSSTMAIDAMFKQMKAEGQDVIGFGAGEPDFATPDHIKLAAIAAILNNDTKYTPSAGTLELRKAICQRMKADCGVEYEPSQVVVSNGAKSCVYQALRAPGRSRRRGHPARPLLGELYRADPHGGRRPRGHRDPGGGPLQVQPPRSWPTPSPTRPSA